MWDRKEKPYVLLVFCFPAIWLFYSLLRKRKTLCIVSILFSRYMVVLFIIEWSLFSRPS